MSDAIHPCPCGAPVGLRTMDLIATPSGMLDEPKPRRWVSCIACGRAGPVRWSDETAVGAWNEMLTRQPGLFA